MYDFVIIGAGIIGTNIARELSKYKLNILLLEKESDVANYQTTANSAIIHSGHDPLPGSLKARLCVEGNLRYESLSKDLSFPLVSIGAFVVAFTKEEIIGLKQLYDRAKENSVPNVSLISKSKLLEFEPNINPSVLLALSLPTTKVTVPWHACIASAEIALLNDLEMRLNSKVTNITHEMTHYEITINQIDKIQTRNIINAAGLFADEIASLIESDMAYAIKPRRGEYFTLDRKYKDLYKHVIYPVPSDLGKGVLITPQIDGHTLIGPSAEDVYDKEDNSCTRAGLEYIKAQAKRISSKIPFKSNIRNFAGLRAKSTYGDFYIKESLEYKGFYHVAGIDSPGLTAAPAIANYVIELIKNNEALIEKKKYIKKRVKPVVFHELSKNQKSELYQKEHEYGNIVCRCEHITKKEIMDAASGVLGAKTVKAIKKRTRAGAGICQGGYCEIEVLKIISEMTGLRLDEIDYYEKNTKILFKDLKVKK